MPGLFCNYWGAAEGKRRIYAVGICDGAEGGIWDMAAHKEFGAAGFCCAHPHYLPEGMILDPSMPGATFSKLPLHCDSPQTCYQCERFFWQATIQLLSADHLQHFCTYSTIKCHPAAS